MFTEYSLLGGWSILSRLEYTPSLILWAVETLEQSLGTDFLHRTAAVPLLFSLGLWPADDVPWVYANLFQLALRIKLLDTRLRPVLTTMRHSVQRSDWIHVLLQLEMAAFGVREGWQILLEPTLDTGKRADVELVYESTRLLMEMVSMQMSAREQEALTFFHTMSQRLEVDPLLGVTQTWKLSQWRCIKKMEKRK